MPTIKPWKTKIRSAHRFLFLFVFVFPILLLAAFSNMPSYFHLLPKIEFAQAVGTCTAKASADWTLATTWTLTSGSGCAVVGGPVAGDTVVVPSSFTVAISTAVAAATININNAGAATGINMTGGSLTLTGALTLAAPRSAKFSHRKNNHCNSQTSDLSHRNLGN